MSEAGEHLDLVGLDLLARAPAVPLLAAAEVGVDRLPLEDEPCGESGDDRDERRPVRFACDDDVQFHRLKTMGRKAARMTSTGADTPVQRSKADAPCRTRTSTPSTTGLQPAASPALTSAVGAPSTWYARSTTPWP